MKTKTKCPSVVIDIVIIVIVSSLICFFMLVGINGFMKSDPAMYLAAGNQILGVVTDKQRGSGAFELIVSTKDFDEMSVGCTADEFNSIDIGDTIKICTKFEISEV